MADEFIFQETNSNSSFDKRKGHAHDVEYFVSVARRRLWNVIIPFCLMMLIGCVLVVKLPKVYESRTLIMVEPQRVPTDYVRPVVTEDISNRINSISQQIMSRTNLEKIIEDFKLYQDPEHKKWYIEDKIEDLRKRIKVRVSNSQKNDSFSISFEGKNPQQISEITNALVNYFMEENLKFRESKAIGTSNFLEDELMTIRKRLEESETRLKEYREKFMGGLPEQLGSNLSILERLQQQLNAKQEALRDAKNRLAMFDMETSAIVKYHVSDLSLISSNHRNVPSHLSKLEEMNRELENLKSRYTANHPDVLRLEKNIKKIAREMEPEKKSLKDQTGKEDLVLTSPVKNTDPVYIREVRKKELETEIVLLEKETKQISDRIDHFQTLVEYTPKREQELLSIKRDYQNVQQSYNSMLDKKLQAEIAVNLEKKQKGEQFRVLDPARVPTKPVRPNMKKLFIVIVAAGLGIGGGIVFLLEFFDTSFRRYQDAETYLDLPVLATIPEIGSTRPLNLQRVGQAAALFGLLIAVVFLGIFSSLSLYGVENTLGLVEKYLFLLI